MLSAVHGKVDFVTLLITHGAEVKAEDEEKLQSLHYAAKCGHVQTCEALLDAGAALEANDVGMWTPLLW